MKRFAVLFVAACGGSETPIATTPCPSVAPTAQPVVDAGSGDADADASAADASSGTSVDAAVAGVLAVRDFVVARMAVATLKTIPSPTPPPREPPRVPSSPRGGFGARVIQAPRLFESTFRISEGLPPEVVRRIVRQNYGRMRLCYEQELRATAAAPKEKVTVRFAIGHDGEVALAEPLAGDATAGFAECYARAFAMLSYPQPMNDLVVVEYGMSFEP